MIKSSQYCQINDNELNVALNVNNNQAIINNEIGFVLITTHGVNEFYSSNIGVEKKKLTFYKASEDSGNPIAGASLSALASQLIPTLGVLAHLFETVNHVREFSEQIFDDTGRKVEVTKNGLENSININPKAALDPTKAFLPMSPFVIPDKPPMEYWKRKRLQLDEEKEQKKTKKYKIGSF